MNVDLPERHNISASSCVLEVWAANTLAGMPPESPCVSRIPPGADPDEYDRLRRRVLWQMPSGPYVVGSTDKGERRNAMTLN